MEAMTMDIEKQIQILIQNQKSLNDLFDWLKSKEGIQYQEYLNTDFFGKNGFDCQGVSYGH